MAEQNLIKALPEVLQINNWDGDVGNWLQSTLKFICLEAGALKPGGETIITGLAGRPTRQKNRPRTCCYPSSAEHNWSVMSLARKIGMSRSAFSERFTKLVGKPVMNYLTQWRMQFARTRIQETSEPLSIIASSVGYKSEAAFCRVFKRRFGVTPGNFRGPKTQFQPAP